MLVSSIHAIETALRASENLPLLNPMGALQLFFDLLITPLLCWHSLFLRLPWFTLLVFLPFLPVCLSLWQFFLWVLLTIPQSLFFSSHTFLCLDYYSSLLHFQFIHVTAARVIRVFSTHPSYHVTFLLKITKCFPMAFKIKSKTLFLVYKELHFLDSTHFSSLISISLADYVLPFTLSILWRS